MNYTGTLYTFTYDPLDQQINFEGIFRPTSDEEASRTFNYLVEIHSQVQG